jgi:Mrp family chromosome partitioning ATPase
VLGVLPRDRHAKVARAKAALPQASGLDPAGTPMAGLAHRLADFLGAPTGRARSLAFLALEPGFDATKLAFAVAVSLSLDDTRVLFVDARGGDGLTAGLDAGEEPGLAEVMGRRFPLERAVFLQDEPGVGILPAGRNLGHVRPTPDRVQAALLTPAGGFAHVLIDAGAPLRDGAALAYAAAVDDVVLVAAAGRTKRPALEESIDLLHQAGASLRGIVLL